MTAGSVPVDPATQERYDVQTAVMDALPHAIHPMFEGWRTKADVLIEGLRDRGYEIVPVRRD